MKQLIIAGVCLLFSLGMVQTTEALTCFIVDEDGYEISYAYGGDTVYLVAVVNEIKTKKLRFNITAKFHSSDSKAFSLSSMHKGFLYHEGSTETQYYWMGVWIPQVDYVISATFTGKLPTFGNCSASIGIIQ